MVRCTDPCPTCNPKANLGWADLFDEARDGIQVWTICCHACGRTIRDAAAAELLDAASALREKADWLVEAADQMTREGKS